MNRHDEQELLRLHLAGTPFEVWGSLKKNGELRTYTTLTFTGEERRAYTFATPDDVKVGQPVLLLITPHGEHCGCEPIYSASRH